jgi:hypothetical protein
MKQPRSLTLTAALVLGLSAAAHAQTTLKSTRILSGLANSTWVGVPPTDDRLFILEQNTRLCKVYTAGGALIGTFINLSAKANSGSEQGLLSMAFDPDFANNKYVYFYYSANVVGSRIERYTVDAVDPNKADPTTAFTILEQSQPFTNHKGGNLLFGPDGYLYFGFGDGGGSGDSMCNAQKGTTRLGKMLRLDVHADDYPADVTRNYGIPSDNPFVGDPNILPEIWNFGLRNPWRWSFDTLTWDFYIGDVGQDAVEEVDFASAGTGGLNFGWKIMEGSTCFGTSSCPVGVPTCGDPSLTLPIHEYFHTGGFGGPCTVIGGVVSRSTTIPGYFGTYYFAEYCDDKIWKFDYDTVGGVQGFQDITSQLIPPVGPGSIAGIRTFGYDHKGEVLFGDGDEVYRISAASQPAFPDCDANGSDDALEITMNPDLDLDGNGQLDLCQTLSADTGTMSVAQGGAQNWSLHAGVGAGGQVYFIGGSVTGTAGIPLGSVVVPLTLDGYTLFTLNHPNQPPLINTLGTLNGSGNASAAFVAPPGLLPPSLVGTQVFHAYAALNSTFTATLASNPVSLSFVP